MLPFLVTVAVAAVFMGMLNSLNRFFIPALSPAMFNVGSIVCAVTLVPLMPRVGMPPIAAMAFGVLLGGLGQLVIQWPSLRREGFHYRPLLDLRDPGLRQVLILMGPGTIGLAATQFNVFVNTVLATGEGTGAVSWLNYAFRLMYLPLGLFGVSIATASMPAIARHAARDDLPGMRHEVANGLAMMLMLNVPATVGLVVLARPIVAMLFERGRFSAHDTDATAAALMCYAIGLVGYSAVKMASPTFYALHESRKPVMVSAASVLLNAALNVALVHRFGYLGLAVGTSITAILNSSVLLELLRRRLGGLEGGRLLGVLVRTLLASGVMGVAAWATERAMETWLPGRGLVVHLVQVMASIAVALAALVGTARLVGLSELTDVIALVVGKLRRTVTG
jgi:putative peptidoglycan lipid II flippase